MHYLCADPIRWFHIRQVKVKKENITLKCKACGAISEVDPRHKLNAFIIKNPPENKMSKEEKRWGNSRKFVCEGGEKNKPFVR